MRTLIWSLVFVVLACVLQVLPLFDLLGFEFSFAMALLVTLAGIDLAAAEVKRARRERSPSQRARDDARPLLALLRLWGASIAGSWLVLLLPLVVSLGNGLRVRNCDRVGGLVWYALLPALSALAATATGVLAAVTVRRARLLGYGVFLASLAWALYRFLAAPPVNAFDPFGGYFPGTLYDENVTVPAALYWARLYHLTASLAALALASRFLDGETLRLKLGAAKRRPLLFTIALSLGALYLGASGGRLGFARSAEDIARALGGERRTEHFVLHYSPTGPFAADLDLHAAEHELRWRELHDLWKIDPGVPIHAYLFDSVAQKQQLMGAAHTSVAKPWRKEIYLQYEAWPHSVLPHELAHVFAGAFGDPLLHVSRDGVSLNLGLIEGSAVAASWHGSSSLGLTPHQQAQVMRKAGIAPPLTEVLGIRFLGFNNGAAYAEAGSFCRWLLDTRGPEPLEKVYRRGGSEQAFLDAYGISLRQLAAEWGRFVDGLEAPESQRQLAEERLSQPSVFHKVCAHELAVRREAASHAAAAGDHVRALQLLDGVCHDDPDDPDNLAELMDAARAGKRDDDARAAAERLMRHPKATPALRARALMLVGDLALARRDFAAAAQAYLAAEKLPLDEASGRLVTVKRMAAQMAPPPDALVRFLVEAAREPPLMLATAQELAQSDPGNGLYLYLYGRQLSERSLFARAAEALERSRRLGLPDARFQREADRIAGIARYRLRQFDASQDDFQRLAEGAPEGVRLAAADWIERIKRTR
jgi:hypothetical protein